MKKAPDWAGLNRRSPKVVEKRENKTKRRLTRVLEQRRRTMIRNGQERSWLSSLFQGISLQIDKTRRQREEAVLKP